VNVQGQVFLATKSGENIRFGAVEVLAYEEQIITNLVATRTRECAESVSRLEDRLGRAEETILSLEADYHKTLRESQQAGRKLEPQQLVIRAIAYNRDYWCGQGREDAEVGSIEKYKLPFFRRYCAREENKLQEAKAALSSLKEAADALKREVSRKQATLDDARRQQAEIIHQMNGTTPTLTYFVDMPKPHGRAGSDADGRFAFKFPKGRRFAVYAHARRELSQPEEYYWLVWVDPQVERQPLLLCNANLFGVASPDQVVTTLFPSKNTPAPLARITSGSEQESLVDSGEDNRAAAEAWRLVGATSFESASFVIRPRDCYEKFQIIQDTNDWVFSAYDAQVVESINNRWFSQGYADWLTKVVITFDLSSNGQITKLKIAEAATQEAWMLDSMPGLCRKAVQQARMPAWPPEMKLLLPRAYRHITVTFTPGSEAGAPVPAVY
jgi:plasmid maintenance system antidote protein VapI